MRFTELTTRSFLPLSAATLLVLSACGGDKTKTTDSASATPPAAAVAADSAMRPTMRDSVASVEVVPPAKNTAEAPLVAGRAPVSRPTTTHSRPTAARHTTSNGGSRETSRAPTASARSSGTVASGTSIRVTSGEKVCSNSLAVGDRITTTTNSAVNGSNGVSIPSGARVSLVVTKSKGSSHQGDEAELAFDVRSVTFGGETYSMTGDVATDAVLTERKGGDAKKVAIGAAAGAIIGNIIGGGSRVQRTVVGAAAGGAAGAVAAAVTGDRYACLPEGSALTVHLGSALTIRN